MTDIRVPLPFGSASPPDDGGHQGSFTQPEDDLDVAHHSDERTPELNTDTTRRPVNRAGVWQVVFLLLLLLVALPVFWGYFVP